MKGLGQFNLLSHFLKKPEPVGEEAPISSPNMKPQIPTTPSIGFHSQTTNLMMSPDAASSGIRVYQRKSNSRSPRRSEVEVQEIKALVSPIDEVDPSSLFDQVELNSSLEKISKERNNKLKTILNENIEARQEECIQADKHHLRQKSEADKLQIEINGYTQEIKKLSKEIKADEKESNGRYAVLEKRKQLLIE